jgi:double-stranded uracil-DNA glycosylase
MGCWHLSCAAAPLPASGNSVRAADQLLTRGDDTGVEARTISVDEELPMKLAHLHRDMPVGSPLALDVDPGDHNAEQVRRLRDVVVGAGFDVDELQAGEQRIRVRARRARTLADTVGPAMRLLVCGLNPSVYAADFGVGYARPGNRFWPAARAAGLVECELGGGGFADHRRRAGAGGGANVGDAIDALSRHGVGMTDLVKRATKGASELTAAEYREGAARVQRLVRWLRPGVVCFVGLAGWRAAVDRNAASGEQAAGFGGVPAYVMPSTSGANAHARLDDLADHLRAAAALSR